MYGKLLIQSDLVVLTGMHIGGSDAFSAIGAVDQPVVRDILSGDPIVPGSSIKGKLRTLLAKSFSKDITKLPSHDQDEPHILRLFGSAQPPRPSRLQFADCFVNNRQEFGTIPLTEVKSENTINRTNSVANPRQIERVAAGVSFAMRIVYNVEVIDELSEDLSLLVRGLRLLQLDYLGGHGSRGSGRVSVRNVTITPFGMDIDSNTMNTIMEHFKAVESYELFSV